MVSRNTLNFIGSPEMIIAFALGGRLSFNPLKDESNCIRWNKIQT